MTISKLCRSLFFAATLSLSQASRFDRPIINRIYEDGVYALADSNRSNGNRVTIAQAAAAIAGLNPTYVSGTYYFPYNSTVTDEMVTDWSTIRTTVHETSPNAKFDVEISLNDHRPDNKPTFANAAAVVAMMKYLNSKLAIDGFWFDFYSNAQTNHPDWVAAAIKYAHSQGQTVGGNVFGSIVPPYSDAVAFVDNTSTTNSPYGFGIKEKEVQKLKANTTTAVILGHIQSNPQNGDTTESCVYIEKWNSTRRADYQNYWVNEQNSLGFKYMFPLFYPLCPGAFSYDPLDDKIAGEGNKTVYDHIQNLASKDAVSKREECYCGGLVRGPCCDDQVKKREEECYCGGLVEAPCCKE